ncbi:MAG: NUDIX hydrolase [Acidimicrobiales bacterium]|jgi:ADP-ribose pyrophosphatase|nr:NUDIX hydrolase [Acidimicrobiales bacterium]
MTEPGPRSASGFRRLGEREVYEGWSINVVVAEFETPEGDTVTRDVVRHPGAVSVVPLDGDEIVLVRQFRSPAEEDLLEIPAGKRDVADEPPEETALRELAEEVGLTTSTPLVPLSEFYNSVGFSDEYSYVYLATDLEPVPLDRQGPEEQHMTIERWPVDDIAAAIADHRIKDAKTVIGLLAALRHLGR